MTEVTAAFGEEQVVYDDQTAHGTKAQVQQQWDSRVERALLDRRGR